MYLQVKFVIYVLFVVFLSHECNASLIDKAVHLRYHGAMNIHIFINDEPCLLPPNPWSHRPRFLWHVGLVTPKERHTPMPLEVDLTTEQQVRIHATPMTPGGHPATVDGDVQFDVQSGDCTVVRIDSMSADIISGSTPGDCVVLVSADADLGAGVMSVQDTILVHLMNPNAASLGLTVDAPVLKV